jgi:hypothetical protein
MTRLPAQAFGRADEPVEAFAGWVTKTCVSGPSVAPHTCSGLAILELISETGRVCAGQVVLLIGMQGRTVTMKQSIVGDSGIRGTAW